MVTTNHGYYVYILLCENNTYYTGITSDLEKRYQAHLDGTASKYTRSFKPVKIAQYWLIADDKSIALKIEFFIKTLSKTKKEQIIKQPGLLLEMWERKL